MLVFGLLFIFGSIGALSAAEASKPAEARTAMGKSLVLPGSLVRRLAPGKAWKPVALKEDVFSGDLLLALPLAFLDLKSGVRLALLSDLDGRFAFPALESAVVLHENSAVDLDFTLDRGRVVLTNHKDTGSAKIKVRFSDQDWDLKLSEPRTRVGLEIYGRWPRGVRFTKDPKPEDVPALDVVMIVLSGQASLEADGQYYLLKAPPEPALFHWDSVSGFDSGPQRLLKQPPWAGEAEIKIVPDLKKKLSRFDRFRHLVAEKSIDSALDEFLASDEPTHRRFAVYAAGAVDDLPRLTNALTQATHADVWNTGVLALRHWLGRDPGQDLKFYHYLIKERKLAPAHAEIVLQLLHSFGARDLSRPDCYEMLIDYLRHDQLAIRGLANWHLHRLVPAGRKINFNPAGTAEEREKAYQDWKKLVPDGQLPPQE